VVRHLAVDGRGLFLAPGDSVYSTCEDRVWEQPASGRRWSQCSITGLIPVEHWLLFLAPGDSMYRGTSHIRKCLPLGPYSRPTCKKTEEESGRSLFLKLRKHRGQIRCAFLRCGFLYTRYSCIARVFISLHARWKLGLFAGRSLPCLGVSQACRGYEP